MARVAVMPSTWGICKSMSNEIVAPLIDRHDRLGAVAHHIRAMALRLEDREHELLVEPDVLDEEDLQGAHRPRRSLAGQGSGQSQPRRRQVEGEPEGRTRARFAANADGAAHRLDQLSC